MDLNEVVRDTAALLERVLGGRIQVACELSPQPAAILGEPVQIEQVLLNLGVNARDAMPEGGRLTFTTRIAAGGWVDLDITDTGAGIPEAHLPHIFEPFFTTKEVGKGTGLGLSMVFGVVTAHQGTITVTSAPGQGTTFHLHLPGTLAFSTEERVRLLEPPELHPTSGLRVLVVDDEPAIREILAESLSLMDLEVVTACDGEDAWRHFQAGSFDLVISDQRMPLCMGTELLARIRATGSQVPFILSSGHGLEGIEAELERDAQVRILPKPFQLKQMTNLAGQLTRLG
jgi:CheY-like chemotaxis protein